MIVTTFAYILPRPWGCIVKFDHGKPVPAQHHPDDFHYRIIAARCGYQDDTLAYAREHEVAHLVAEEVLFGRPSRVLWGLAHDEPLDPAEAAYEEAMAQMLQRFARANERPIIGPGIDWDAMRRRFEEVLSK
jgi:hypothetical protein